MIRKMNEESAENETFKPELGYLSKQDICSLYIRFRFRFRFRGLNFMSYHGRTTVDLDTTSRAKAHHFRGTQIPALLEIPIAFIHLDSVAEVLGLQTILKVI